MILSIILIIIIIELWIVSGGFVWMSWWIVVEVGTKPPVISLTSLFSTPINWSHIIISSYFTLCVILNVLGEFDSLLCALLLIIWSLPIVIYLIISWSNLRQILIAYEGSGAFLERVWYYVLSYELVLGLLTAQNMIDILWLVPLVLKISLRIGIPQISLVQLVWNERTPAHNILLVLIRI